MTKTYFYFLLLTFFISPIYSTSQTEEKYGDERVCLLCSNPAPNRCSQCKKFYYCSRECQVKHWKAGHKKNCKKLKKMTTAVFMTHQMTQDKDLQKACKYFHLSRFLAKKDIQILSLCTDIARSRATPWCNVSIDSFIQNPALKELLKKRVEVMISLETSLFLRDYTEATQILEKHPWLPILGIMGYHDNITSMCPCLVEKPNNSVDSKEYESVVFYLAYMHYTHFNPHAICCIIPDKNSGDTVSLSLYQYLFDAIMHLQRRSIDTKDDRRKMVANFHTVQFLLLDKLTQHPAFKPNDDNQEFGKKLGALFYHMDAQIYDNSSWGNALLSQCSKRVIANLLRNPYTVFQTQQLIKQRFEKGSHLNVDQDLQKLLNKAASYQKPLRSLAALLVNGLCKKEVADCEFKIPEDPIGIINNYLLGNSIEEVKVTIDSVDDDTTISTSTYIEIGRVHESKLKAYLDTSCTYCLMPLPATTVKCCEDTYCSEACEFKDTPHEQQANCTKNNASITTAILLPILGALPKL